jgi:magnesium-dependent phosphatase-1
VPKDIRLVVFDCDLTLWNHEDASALVLPFVLVDKDTIRDKMGTQVALFPQVRAMLAELERRGCLLSICSWNNPEPVLRMLKLFGLTRYFQHPKAEPHPDKGDMISRTLAEFAAEGVPLTPAQVVFTDDRTVHTAQILERLPGLHVLQMWVDVKDHNALLAWLDEE